MSNNITNLTTTYDVSLVTLTNIPNEADKIAKVFKGISDNEINIDMISKTAPYRDMTNVSFTLSDDDFPKALTFLSAIKKEYSNVAAEVSSGNTKITVAGEGMRNAWGVAAGIFDLIASCGGEIILITTAETEISVLVDNKNVDDITNKIKEKYEI